MEKIDTDIKGTFELTDRSLFRNEIPKEHWAHCNIKGLKRQDSHLVYLEYEDSLKIGEKCPAELRFKFRDEPKFKLKIRVGDSIELNIGSKKYGEIKVDEILNSGLSNNLNKNEITIRTNLRMQKYLNDLGYNFKINEINLSNELTEVLESEFIVENDMVTLSAINEIHRNPKRETSSKKSEWEYDTTKIHIDNFVENSLPEIEILKTGLEYIKRLACKLSNEFINEEFIIILSFYETISKNGEIEIYGSGVSRFHKKRKGEFWFNPHKLDEFKSEAIITLEIK